MSTIVTSNTTTQLLVKNEGVDIYTSLKLPSDQVTMDNPFFQDRSVNDVMPQIYIDEVGQTLTPDASGFCTWEIKNDPANNIVLTEKSVILNVKDRSGNTVIPASSLITYGTSPNTTYALHIYIKSSGSIFSGDYSAVIQL